MRICKPRLTIDPRTLTQHDFNFLSLMPDGEWISWSSERFKGVNRPHFRCVRLWQAGYLEWGIPPTAEAQANPYNAVQVRKIKGEPACV